MSEEKDIQTMIGEIKLKLKSDYEDDARKMAEAFIKDNPFWVDHIDSALDFEPVEGWYVIDIETKDPNERIPSPKYNSFKTKAEARKKAEELYPNSTEGWLKSVVQKLPCDFDFYVGSQKKTEEGKITSPIEDEQIKQIVEGSIKKMSTRIKILLNTSASNGVIRYRDFKSLDDIKSELIEIRTEYLRRQWLYHLNYKTAVDGPLRLMKADEIKTSQHHDAAQRKPNAWVKPRWGVAPNPRFVLALYQFLTGSTTVSISKALAVSHFAIAKEYGEKPELRLPVASENGLVGTFTNSPFKETARAMAKNGFTIQVIIDPLTKQCVGTLNLSKIVKYLSKRIALPDTLEPGELARNNLLGTVPPILDVNEPLSRAESLFASGFEAVLFRLRDPINAQDSEEADLPAGLHIMTPHDAVVYRLLVGE
jgi:hypothetical protein